MTCTILACRREVKGIVRVAGRAVELQATPRWALDSLSGAVTDGLLWQQTRVVMVDEVAKDAAVWECHSEVLHLQTDMPFYFLLSKTTIMLILPFSFCVWNWVSTDFQCNKLFYYLVIKKYIMIFRKLGVVRHDWRRWIEVSSTQSWIRKMTLCVTREK